VYRRGFVSSLFNLIANNHYGDKLVVFKPSLLSSCKGGVNFWMSRSWALVRPLLRWVITTSSFSGLSGVFFWLASRL